MTHEIKIEIKPDGTIESEVLGVAGPDCSKISAWLDDLGEVKEDRKTKDFYKQPAQKVGAPKVGRK